MNPVAERRPAAGHHQEWSTVACRRHEDERAGNDREKNEVLGVRREAEDLRVQRLHGVDGGGDEPRAGPAEACGEEIHQHRRGRGDDDEAHADRRDRLAERAEDQGIGGVDAGGLEIVGIGVGRHPREQELAEVRVLAFVAIEGDVEQPEPDRRRRQDNDGD